MIYSLKQSETPAPNWQREMAEAFTQLDDLFTFLNLGHDLLPASIKAAGKFPFRVPRSFASRMEKSNIDDPLLRQVLPSLREFDTHSDFIEDPVGDLPARAGASVLQKYRGRALLITTGACAVNCRYCFRREFPYSDNQLGKSHEAQALEYIKRDPTISEIILSGGDPLVLGDRRLAALAEELAAIPHLKRLRLHTRLPIVLPNRITRELVEWLSRTRLQTIVVVHANHPNELNDEVADSLAPLKQAGVALLNQSVLLRGVNDTAEALTVLSERLFAAGIMPYYLHLLDKTAGTTHFDVSREKARELHWELRRQLPGYLVPRLACEQPGAPFKLTVEEMPMNVEGNL
ncbi:MAG: EF-P beta-lysylation protein EpmB [Pseudomonadota bacterium]